MAKFKFILDIGLVGCKKTGEVEIDAEDLEGLTGIDREQAIWEHLQDWSEKHISLDYEELT